jgi:hypothetical protein
VLFFAEILADFLAFCEAQGLTVDEAVADLYARFPGSPAVDDFVKRFGPIARKKQEEMRPPRPSIH